LKNFLLNFFISILAYNTLKDISETPLHLFAFIYYHKCVLEEIKREKLANGQLTETQANSIYGKGWGKGQRKAVIKWYNERSEEDILRLITKYRRSHSWSHKDVIKIAHIKPSNSAIAIIFKYLMFGIDKIQNEKISENEKYVFDFINDYEKVSYSLSLSLSLPLIYSILIA
jgi:60 kDa SS-A/Ro ribonucleoprotein